MSARIAAGSSNCSAKMARMLRIRPCSISLPAHSSFRIAVDSASRPMCQAQRGSSILRIGLTATLVPRKCEHPGLDHAAQRIQRRAAVGQADHRVVARLALPVERGVGAVEHVEVDLGEVALRLDDQPADAAVAVAARRASPPSRGRRAARGRPGWSPSARGRTPPRRAGAAASSVPSRRLRRITCASWSTNIGGMSIGALNRLM